MTVYAIMPVFNRLADTRAMLACLQAQQLDGNALEIIVVDDGSTDGTAEFLATQSGVTCLTGNGSLWWGGAVDLAVRRVLKSANDADWVLLVNNDMQVGRDYVQRMLECASSQPHSAIGSVIRDVQGGKILSVGPRIDAQKLRVDDFLDAAPAERCAAKMPTGVHPVHALSGRGALLPVSGLRAVGGLRPRWLPHYLADYELSLRLRSAGWKLLITEEIAVYSADSYGSRARAGSVYARFASVRSPTYLPALVAFWWQASTWTQRATLPLRAALFAIFPRLRRR